jgi:hypothetical protein
MYGTTKRVESRSCGIPKNKEIEKNNLESKIIGNLFSFLVNSEIGKFLSFMAILNFEFYNCNKLFDCWEEI